MVTIMLLLYSANGFAFDLILRGEKDAFLQVSKMPVAFTSFTECNEALRNSLQQLIHDGYLTASIDSLEWNEKQASALVTVGKKYQWATLKNSNIPSFVLSQLRFDERNYIGKPIQIERISDLFDKVIRYFENHGYPFARLRLDSLQLAGKQLEATMLLQKGPLRRLDTIIVNEGANISRHYLLQYLGLKQGMIYDESKIKNIRKRIAECSFLEEAAPWKLEFNVVETKLYLYLRNKSANRADVLIGLLPNNDERGGKFLLTGDIKLAFTNALALGENFSFNWQNLQYQSPRYNIDFQAPYLFNTSLGVSGKFDFYKKDTSFKTVQGEAGLFYQFDANSQLKFFYELASSRLLSVNTNALISSRKLPELGDVTYRSFGLETLVSRVDYKLNPRKGYRVQARASVSFRHFLKNNTIETTTDPVLNKPFSYLYDSLQLQNYKYSIKGSASYFLPLSKRIVLATTYSGGYAFSTNTLYKNEIFQIGGYRLLRGFDEGSLFVNHYEVLSIEPRFLFAPNSYFFLLSDLSYLQANYASIQFTDKTYSAGLGMTFETKTGLFNMSYAIGSRKQQPFQFKNSKLHFGYVNYF